MMWTGISLACAGWLLGILVGLSAQTSQEPRRTLDLYFIDVEGGAATLIVTPSGESVLLDAGWADVDGRDAKRIQSAMKAAGVTRIDHLVASHYHVDHYGGVPDLARIVTIGRFYDHGPMAVMAEDKQFEARYGAYRTAARQNTTTVHPGFRIPLKGDASMTPTLMVVASGGAVKSGDGAPNAACTTANAPPDTSENGRSVGLLLQWGAFEFLNLADLTWNVSQRLVCPSNQLGAVDLYQVTHHGGNTNNPSALLQSISPTVAVMVNGPRKGGHPDTIRLLQELPTLRALYQLHRNVQIDATANIGAALIANLEEAPDKGHHIAVSVDPAKRELMVVNGRTGEKRVYPVR